MLLDFLRIAVENFITLSTTDQLLLYMQLFNYEIRDMFFKFQSNFIFPYRLMRNKQIMNFKQFSDVY
jgi:hypothetical protein